jgi:hypothetical protein
MYFLLEKTNPDAYIGSNCVVIYLGMYHTRNQLPAEHLSSWSKLNPELRPARVLEWLGSLPELDAEHVKSEPCLHSRRVSVSCFWVRGGASSGNPAQRPRDEALRKGGGGGAHPVSGMELHGCC